jgi:hypothetical protein
MRLFSLGKLCERSRRPVSQIESAITDLRIEPALELNDLRYYDEKAETAIGDELYLREMSAFEQLHKNQRRI